MIEQRRESEGGRAELDGDNRRRPITFQSPSHFFFFRTPPFLFYFSHTTSFLQRPHSPPSLPLSQQTQAGRDSEQSGDRFAKTAKKALSVNLNPLWYGVFAEIGAGQEVARWFFRVGAAAGTIAKSVSAYDMLISDTMYGAAAR